MSRDPAGAEAEGKVPVLTGEPTHDLARPEQARPRSSGFDVVLAGLAGLVAALLTVPILRLWRADVDVPFAYSGDANSHGMLVKAVLDHGWYENNPSLGTPFVQHFNDFPMPDNLHLVAAKVLGIAFDSYGAVVNLYFLAGFALAAFFAALVLRSLGISRAVSLVVSVLYAFAPYHFIRGEAQLFLASFYAAPLGVYLALGALGHVELFPARKGANGLAARLSWGTAATLGMCVLVGSSSAYYGAFAVILIGVVIVGQGLANRDRHAAVAGLVVAGAIALTVGANVAPDVLWQRAHGKNTAAVVRAPGDTETYSLKLTQLLLPSPHHRVDQLGDVADRYLGEFPLPSEPHPLGAAAAIGVLYLLGVVATTLLRSGSEPRAVDPSHRLTVHLGVLTLASLLVAMTGGLSSLFELLVIPILRGWNRIAIFVAFLGLVAVSQLLDRLRRRPFDRRPAAFALVLLVVAALGLLDQTSPEFVPDFAGNRARFQNDADFVARIEGTLPRGSMVFQLPFVPFPEAGPLNGMVDYDHFRGYLHSKDLRWSYGGIQGRPESDWAGGVSFDDPAEQLTRLASVGVAGVYLDRAGYLDEGRATEAAIAEVLGTDPIVSRDGRLSFFDLRDFREGLVARDGEATVDARRRAELDPIGVEVGAGFYDLERYDQTMWRWAQSDSELVLDNTGSSSRPAMLDFRAATRAPTPSNLTIEAPGRPPQTIRVTAEPTRVRLPLELPPGESTVRLHVDAPDMREPGEQRDLRVQVANLHVIPLLTSGSEGVR